MELAHCVFHLAVIGLYTPINYFGWYATCSHKDGGRSIFSLGKPLARRTTWYAYNYVGARKFKSCVFEPLTRRVFSINTSSSSTLFLFDQFSSQRQHSLWPNFSAAANTMNGPRRHSYTRTMRRFPVSEKLPVSNHRKRTFSTWNSFCSLVVLHTHTHTHTHTSSHIYTHYYYVSGVSNIFYVSKKFYCYSI